MLLFEAGTEGCIQEEVEIERWEHPEHLWNMEIPSGFGAIDEEKIREDFPYDVPPEIVLYSEKEKAWITIQVFDKKLNREETEEAGEAIRKLMDHTYPQYEMTPVYCFDEGEIPVAWFAMTMEERKEEHVKGVFSLKSQRERLVLMTFTYPEEEKDKWRAVLSVMFSSIEEERKEGRNGTSRKGGL